MQNHSLYFSLDRKVPKDQDCKISAENCFRFAATK